MRLAKVGMTGIPACTRDGETIATGKGSATLLDFVDGAATPGHQDVMVHNFDSVSASPGMIVFVDMVSPVDWAIFGAPLA